MEKDAATAAAAAAAAAAVAVDVESGVPSRVLCSPLEVRLSLVPELTSGKHPHPYSHSPWPLSYEGAEYDDADGPGGDAPWPADPSWAEAERMLGLTAVLCALALSAAWCLMLLTVLSSVLGIRINLWW